MIKEKKELKVEIEIPEGVNVEVVNGIVKAKGKAGEVSKLLFNPNIKIEVVDKNVNITAIKSTKRERKLVNSYAAHVRNILNGSNEKYIYKLKICSGHFPMSVAVKDNEFIVKNFFGEKIPRIIKIKEGADVKVEGDIINVESPNKEIAGQVAADIEHLTKRANYDSRVFQDGIWITEKAGKKIK